MSIIINFFIALIITGALFALFKDKFNLKEDWLLVVGITLFIGWPIFMVLLGNFQPSNY